MQPWHFTFRNGCLTFSHSHWPLREGWMLIISALCRTILTGNTDTKMTQAGTKQNLLNHFWSAFVQRCALMTLQHSVTLPAQAITAALQIIHILCIRVLERTCLWASTWQLHNSNNSSVVRSVVFLCCKHDISLAHGLLIVPWVWVQKRSLRANCHPEGLCESKNVSCNNMQMDEMPFIKKRIHNGLMIT